jgi:hypothetical protein
MQNRTALCTLIIVLAKVDNRRLVTVIILFFLTFVGSLAAFCFITFTNKFNEGIVEVGFENKSSTGENIFLIRFYNLTEIDLEK